MTDGQGSATARPGSGDFERDVHDVARLIPPGRVTSYGAIARYLGAVRSSRMVGWAMNRALEGDASGDTKTTQFGYKGMSDFTKHKDEGRRDSYLARHGSKGQNQNWKDPTTAGALSRYVLWEKTSLPAAKSAFKKRFNLRAEETHARYSVADLGYQESIFLTDPGRRAVWDYETDYSVEDAE